MDTIITALSAIARMAPSADRGALVSLDAKRRTLDAAAKVAMGLGTMDDAGILATGQVHVAAQEAIQMRFATIEAQQSSLIQALPSDRRSRSTLQPALTPSDLINRLDEIEKQVTHVTRNEGTPFHLLCDGAPVGPVNAHEISFSNDELAIGNLVKFPLARIVATSITDEDDFAILLDDGTLFEIQEDENFVWTESNAKVA